MTLPGWIQRWALLLRGASWRASLPGAQSRRAGVGTLARPKGEYDDAPAAHAGRPPAQQQPAPVRRARDATADVAGDDGGNSTAAIRAVDIEALWPDPEDLGRHVEDFWPQSVAHLKALYQDAGSAHVVIAEATAAAVGGHRGQRYLVTGLVPLERVDELMQMRGASDSAEVRANGPYPCVREGERLQARGFWIDCFGERVEPLVHAWTAGNHQVMLPDDNLLMTFGLVPRSLHDGTTCWDDPSGPEHDVLRVRPHSDLRVAGEERAPTRIKMRRDYLTRYAAMKGCAVVAFYEEERWSADDAAFDQALGQAQIRDFEWPARDVRLHRVLGMGEPAPQFTHVNGRALVLRPSGPPDAGEDVEGLEWPDHAGPMTLRRAGAEMLHGFVNDTVLRAYEGRDFTLYPGSGGVAYRNQWAVSRTRRHGRNHIQVELKKLYEGCPAQVVRHWHAHAVPQADADRSRHEFGERHIGSRAEAVCEAYLQLTKALARLAVAHGLRLSSEAIGSFDPDRVRFEGWHRNPSFVPLAKVVPPSIGRDDYLDRAKELHRALIEPLRGSALGDILAELGIDKKALGNGGSIKLLAAIGQLASLCRERGLDWPAHVRQVAGDWRPDSKLDAFAPLFALYALRQLDAHRQGGEFDDTLRRNSLVFGVDPAAMVAGWGIGVDALYDRLVESFHAIGDLVEPER